MPAHGHVVNSHSHGGGYHDHGGGYHQHTINTFGGASGQQPHAITFGEENSPFGAASSTNAIGANITAQSVVAAEAPGTNSIGGGGAHETMQPSVFVPWIVKLDD
jgi:hypothetical protein